MRKADLRPFAALSPTDITAYVGALGWALAEDQPPWTRGNSQVWVNRSTETELLVPLRPDFDDYARLVAAACATVAAGLDTDSATILRRIAAIGYDTIRLRVAAPNGDDTLALADAVVLLRESRTMLTAIAASFVEPIPTHPKRKPPGVNDYIDRLQMAQTERGSFVLAIRSPIDLESEAPAPQQRLAFGDEPPSVPLHEGLDGRAIVMSIVDAVAAACAALPLLEAHDYGHFDEVVHAGVSSNLYEALADLARVGNSTVELSVDWSPKVPLEPDDSERLLSPVLLSRSLRAPCKAAAERLKSLAYTEPIRVDGPIAKVDHVPGSMHGEVAVSVPVAGTTRDIWLALGPPDFERALNALATHRTISCIGIPRKRGRRLVIEATREFEVSEG